METLNNLAQELKLEWSQPKLVELDANKTESGDIYSVEINTTAGPS